MKRTHLFNLKSLLVMAVVMVGYTAHASGTLQFVGDKAKCGTWGPDSLHTIKSLSLYKEFYKQDNYDEAIKYWRYVFKNAPGVKEYPLIDGIVMYKHFVDKASDKALQAKLADTLMMVYDQRLICFGEDADVLGRKAIDMVKYQPDELEKTRATFERAMEMAKAKTPYYLLYPYITVLAKSLQKDLMTKTDILNKYTVVSDIIDENVANNGSKGQKYEDQRGYIDDLLSKMDVFDCTSLVPIMKERYAANPDDPDVLEKVYNQLKAAGCYDDPLFEEVAEKANKLNPNEARTVFLAGRAYKNKNYNLALQFYQQAVELAKSGTDKADYYFSMAQIYQKLDDFPTSRSLARQAISLKPNWGDPYLLIGDLYSSSGKKCGPGTGFKSQVVTWPAIDMYEKAKAVDPSVTSRANQKIAGYSKYMPTQEDCFFHQLKEGQSFTVECWINETTTVRCAQAQ